MQYGFRKWFNSEQCVLKTDKCLKSCDEGGYAIASPIKLQFTNAVLSSYLFCLSECENVAYWYTIVICRNQFTIFIPTRSTTIADYSGINYLLQVLVFLVKIGIISIVSGSKKSKFNIF